MIQYNSTCSGSPTLDAFAIGAELMLFELSLPHKYDFPGLYPPALTCVVRRGNPWPARQHWVLDCCKETTAYGEGLTGLSGSTAGTRQSGRVRQCDAYWLVTAFLRCFSFRQARGQW